MQVWVGRSHDESIQVHTEGGGFKPGEFVYMLTVYFPYLKIFSIKKKNENDWSNGGFIDVNLNS